VSRWAAAVLVLAIWAVVGRLHPDFECNRWDNFEYFTPCILQAHNQWLAGELPAINPHQSLGEPLIPSGQPGVFYFPYTLGVLLLHALALPPENLMAILWCLHLPWAALGFSWLLRDLGVRPAFNVLTSVSVCFGGYVVSVSLGWIFMLAIFAWLPWILWGLVQVLSGDRPRWGGLALTVCLGAVANVGSPQMAAYVWALTVAFFLVFGLWVFQARKRMLAALAPLVAGALLGAPTLVPMFQAMPNTSRAEMFSAAEFLERGVPWPVLWEWFCPLVKVQTDFLRDRATILGYQGAWVVGALIAGVSVFSVRERLPRVFVALLGLAVLFTLLALGAKAFLYPLTYGIPVWSSFRWPFKFFLIGQVLVALAAGVGLELGVARWRRWVVVGIPLLVTGFLLLTRANGLSWGWITIVVVTMILVGWCDRPWAQGTLVAAGALSAAVTLVSCNQPGLKTYRERYGEAGANVLGIDTAYRVLPLTSPRAPVNGEWPMQWLGLFHSATMNGYFSATGNTAGLIPDRFATCLPTQVDGALSYGYAAAMLPSHLLRTLNIKYVLVASGDAVAQAFVEEAGGYRVLRRWPAVVVYQNEDALPRAFFASEVRPFSYEAMREGLLANHATPTTAYVDQWPETAPVTQGDLRRATYGTVEANFEITAPAGGFLVFSQRYDPGWRAWVDGRATPVQSVNLTLMGVAVPAGARHVEFRYSTPGLRLGTLLAVTGLFVLAGWQLSRTRSDTVRFAASAAKSAPAGWPPAGDPQDRLLQ